MKITTIYFYSSAESYNLAHLNRFLIFFYYTFPLWSFQRLFPAKFCSSNSRKMWFWRLFGMSSNLSQFSFLFLLLLLFFSVYIIQFSIFPSSPLSCCVFLLTQSFLLFSSAFLRANSRIRTTLLVVSRKYKTVFILFILTVIVIIL